MDLQFSVGQQSKTQGKLPMTKTLTRAGIVVAILAAVCCPSRLFAGQATGPKKISTDVILTDGGVLRGAIVTPEGRPVAGVKIDVRSEQKVIASVKSDEKGRFEIKRLRRGLHSIHAGQQQKLVRLWDAKTAPPKALKSLAIVESDEVTRGQDGIAGLLSGGGTTGSGVGIGTVGLAVTAATATVVAVDASNDYTSSSASP